MSKFETVEITRKDAPDVRFRGKLIADADSRDDTRQERRQKDRWTRLEVWELESGDWVAASIGCSDKPGEIDVGEVQRIRLAEEEMRPIGEDGKEGAPEKRSPESMQRSAMSFFGWSWLAKALARNAGWDVVERIE